MSSSVQALQMTKQVANVGTTEEGEPATGKLGSRKVSEVDHQEVKNGKKVALGFWITLLALGVAAAAFFWGYGELALQDPTWVLAGQATFGVCLSVLALTTIIACARHHKSKAVEIRT